MDSLADDWTERPTSPTVDCVERPKSPTVESSEPSHQEPAWLRCRHEPSSPRWTAPQVSPTNEHVLETPSAHDLLAKTVEQHDQTKQWFVDCIKQLESLLKAAKEGEESQANETRDIKRKAAAKERELQDQLSSKDAEILRCKVALEESKKSREIMRKTMAQQAHDINNSTQRDLELQDIVAEKERIRNLLFGQRILLWCWRRRRRLSGLVCLGKEGLPARCCCCSCLLLVVRLGEDLDQIPDELSAALTNKKEAMGWEVKEFRTIQHAALERERWLNDEA